MHQGLLVCGRTWTHASEGELMADINLFGNTGFQERIADLEIRTNSMEKKVNEKTGKIPSFRRHELLAALLALVIGFIVWWYFTLTTRVKSEIREYTPQEYMMKLEPESSAIAVSHNPES